MPSSFTLLVQLSLLYAFFLIFICTRRNYADRGEVLERVIRTTPTSICVILHLIIESNNCFIIHSKYLQPQSMPTCLFRQEIMISFPPVKLSSSKHLRVPRPFRDIKVFFISADFLHTGGIRWVVFFSLRAGFFSSNSANIFHLRITSITCEISLSPSLQLC